MRNMKSEKDKMRQLNGSLEEAKKQGIYTAYRSNSFPRKNLGVLGNILKKKCFTDRNKKGWTDTNSIFIYYIKRLYRSQLSNNIHLFLHTNITCLEHLWFTMHISFIVTKHIVTSFRQIPF